MQASFLFAQAVAFSTLDSVFAASVALGFAFALLLVLTSGRTPKVRLFKLGRVGRVRLVGRVGPTSPTGPTRLTSPTSPRASLWESVPGALPVGIGSFLIGFGLCGLALRSFPITDLGRALMSGAFGTLFTTLFLLFVAHYFGGGAKEDNGSALVGAIARVSLEIPSDGSGRIAFEKGGRRGTMPARCQDGRAMPKGTTAFVVGVESGTALVEEF
jgi:hypothetical protein